MTTTNDVDDVFPNTSPLSGTYHKFKHLDSVLRDGAASEDPILRAAAEMWIAMSSEKAIVGAGELP